MLWALPATRSGRLRCRREKFSCWEFTEIFPIPVGYAGNTVCLIWWLIK